VTCGNEQKAFVLLTLGALIALGHSQHELGQVRVAASEDGPFIHRGIEPKPISRKLQIPSSRLANSGQRH
jgi:hypothetical protein